MGWYCILWVHLFEKLNTLFNTILMSYKNEPFLNLIFRYWWTRLTVLAKQEDWNELDKLSKVKKSPIGYEVNELILFIIK